MKLLTGVRPDRATQRDAVVAELEATDPKVTNEVDSRGAEANKHTKAECVHALKGLALPRVSHSGESPCRAHVARVPCLWQPPFRACCYHSSKTSSLIIPS
jgi:hypothetical protein